MFSPFPLTPIILNPNDCQDWDSLQNSGQDDYSDSSASDNLGYDNDDRTATDDGYSDVNESTYNDGSDYNSYGYDDSNKRDYGDDNPYQVLNSDVTVHHEHRHKLVQPRYDDSGASGDSDDSQSQGIDYKEDNYDYYDDCGCSKYDDGTLEYDNEGDDDCSCD
ncbi:hypothetical protein [Pseudanabaena sp. ABRG5-3]|uniref:hypothetical protein n=1 Tax=Pseudanabaena sp. ABRG5-3 TaxID=685565 RepID=UPI000DC70F12|nr:hypothetical protein [Pseudanabaena sp. ABRG5-3]BBC25584.1 hypothetical protein ABRG53_3327 [Pseudanabaena sp. ABRG5-3]